MAPKFGTDEEMRKKIRLFTFFHIGNVFIFLMILIFLSFSGLFQMTDSNEVIDTQIPLFMTVFLYLALIVEFFIGYGFILPKLRKTSLEEAFPRYISILPALVIDSPSISGFVSGLAWLMLGGSVNWILVLPMFVFGFISGVFFYFNLPTDNVP